MIISKLENMVRQFGSELKTRGIDAGRYIVYHANPLNDLEYARNEVAKHPVVDDWPFATMPIAIIKHMTRGAIIGAGTGLSIGFSGAIEHIPLNQAVTGALATAVPAVIDIAQFYVRSAIDHYLSGHNGEPIAPQNGY